MNPNQSPENFPPSSPEHAPSEPLNLENLPVIAKRLMIYELLHAVRGLWNTLVSTAADRQGDYIENIENDAEWHVPESDEAAKHFKQFDEFIESLREIRCLHTKSVDWAAEEIQNYIGKKEELLKDVKDDQVLSTLNQAFEILDVIRSLGRYAGYGQSPEFDVLVDCIERLGKLTGNPNAISESYANIQDHLQSLLKQKRAEEEEARNSRILGAIIDTRTGVETLIELLGIRMPPVEIAQLIFTTENLEDAFEMLRNLGQLTALLEKLENNEPLKVVVVDDDTDAAKKYAAAMGVNLDGSNHINSPRDFLEGLRGGKLDGYDLIVLDGYYDLPPNKLITDGRPNPHDPNLRFAQGRLICKKIEAEKLPHPPIFFRGMGYQDLQRGFQEEIKAGTRNPYITIIPASKLFNKKDPNEARRELDRLLRCILGGGFENYQE